MDLYLKGDPLLAQQATESQAREQAALEAKQAAEWEAWAEELLGGFPIGESRFGIEGKYGKGELLKSYTKQKSEARVYMVRARPVYVLDEKNAVKARGLSPEDLAAALRTTNTQ